MPKDSITRSGRRIGVQGSNVTASAGSAPGKVTVWSVSVGAALVKAAAEGCRAAGCEWLHVDFEDHLRSFCFDACGFRETTAGLIAL
jgi:hypothetical protein